jgi:hypothetical protein
VGFALGSFVGKDVVGMEVEVGYRVGATEYTGTKVGDDDGTE